MVLVIGCLLFSLALRGQSHLTLPWDGGNQKSQVSQWIGLVKVTITYFSPDVTGPNGEDRKGKIWGDLVPYNNGDPYPWRAGANHNTVFSTSHDVSIEGELLKAGSYGLHMIPSETNWSIIFSHNSTSWGSFSYNPDEDALRVTVEPQSAEYTEWLTYNFEEKLPDQTIATLRWENLEIPFRITADVNQLYLQKIRQELRDEAGFTWQSWYEAAKFSLENEINYEEALEWVNRSISGDYFSQENAQNLLVKAGLLEKLGQPQAAKAAVKRALELGNPDQLYQYGRTLIREEKTEEALEVFKTNHKRHGDAWPVHLGLGRGYRAVGDPENAVKHFTKALEDAPNNRQKINIQRMIDQLEITRKK